MPQRHCYSSPDINPGEAGCVGPNVEANAQVCTRSGTGHIPRLMNKKKRAEEHSSTKLN
jgi:hypothetical protein